MTTRFASPFTPYLDGNGAPLVGGKLHFYETGSSTVEQDTYSDTSLSVPNSNPIVLNARGESPVDIFLASDLTYRVVLTDSNDVTIWTADSVTDPASGVAATFAVYPGDPNGNLAGVAGAFGGVGSSVVYDSVNDVLYVCTTTGTSSTAVWTANTAGSAGLGAANVFTAAQTIQLTDAGAAIGPMLIFDYESATPAASDEAIIVRGRGEDSAGNDQTYVDIAFIITDPTSASEDARLRFGVVTAGTLAYELELSGANLYPTANDGLALGLSGTAFADLFLASGAVINFNAGDVTITHAADTLTFAGASSGILFSNTPAPSTSDLVGLGTASLMWADLFLASGAVINFNNGDVLLTHSANTLALTGATVYSFDGAVRPSANDAAALGASGTAWSDLFLASGAVINFSAGDVTVTHAANSLAFGGASSGYSFDAPTTITSSAAGAALTISSTDGGAATGPILVLNRDSASPAVNDVLGQVQWEGEDSGGATQIYGYQYVRILDPVAATEDGAMVWGVVTGGVVGDDLRLAAGVFSPAASDGAALGSASLMWADLFLASGAVLNFNNGNATITHSSGLITISALAGSATQASFSAHKNGTNQTISSTNATKVTFGTERFDVGAKFASSTWTPPAGTALISAKFRFDGVTEPDFVFISIYKNGNEFSTSGDTTNVSGFGMAGITLVDQCNGSDTYEIYAKSLVDTSYTIHGSSLYTSFTGTMV